MRWSRVLLLLAILVVGFQGIRTFSERDYLYDQKQKLRNWLAQNYENPEVLENLGIGQAQARLLLIDLLSDHDERVRVNALQILSTLQATEAVPSTDAVPSILPLLANESWRTRFFAAEALGRLGSQSALSALLAAWDVETVLQVRSELTIAIAKLGNQAALQQMTVAFQDNDPYRKVFAAIILLETSEGRASKQHLEAVLKTTESPFKKLVLMMLAEIEGPKAVELLELATQDSDLEIREKAQKYLGRLRERRK